jgi:hypothetical protein
MPCPLIGVTEDMDNCFKTVINPLSAICQEDVYLLELVRYIQLNPLRANMVKDVKGLNGYAYSGHSALLGKIERPWQDTGYVLSLFWPTIEAARRAYLNFVQAGLGQGQRRDLTGGELIRSLGGWEEVKKGQRDGAERLKGDERILGDSEFVLDILKQAEEKMTRRYELKEKGYGLPQLKKRIEELLGVQAREIYAKDRRKEIVEARNLFCYWVVREIGLSNTEIGKKLGLTQPAVGYAVRRGESLARERGLKLEP